ncbi:MAG: DUF2971 domain-containing protein [Fermentimonas sp.]|nr:DUF2971 domain-containing protein [Fermentimonas sp.]
MEFNDFVKKMIHKGIPSEVFKYMRIDDYLFNTLEKGELWFSSPLNFNDPFDCQLNDQTEWTLSEMVEYLNSINIPKDKMDLFLSEYHSPELFSQYFTKQMKSIISTMGVTCFTISPKNMIMWSHYGNSHTGVCLKFDMRKDLDFFKQSFMVDYSSDYPKYDYIQNRGFATVLSMTTKSEHWSYENEVRTIRTKGNKAYAFDKNSLTEIIFGVKADDQNIKLVIDKCQNNGYNNLEFKKIVFKPMSFDIEIISL